MTILEDARAVLAETPVCDACLGRCFAERSFGLSNAERGRALRTAVALADDEPYEEPGEPCWVCEGASGRFDEFADLVVDAVADASFDTYQVGTQAPPLVEENEAMLRDLAGLAEDAGEPFKSECNREVGKRVGDRTGTEVDFGRPDVLAVIDVEAETVDVTVNSAFVYGRYRKLERGIPQTKWPCSDCNGSGTLVDSPCPHCDGTGFLYPESVEQLTAPPVVDAMGGTEASFHGAGREDIDALMLGTGRPFVIEVAEPQDRHPDADALADAINDFADGKAEVEGVAVAGYEMVERVKELDARKRYRADVEFDAPVGDDDLRDAIDELDGATIEQETPNRVDHRRAHLVRERDVYDITADREDDTHATVEIEGEGGLYIKELVSSDDGRTNPSLAGLLGVGAVVTALDVVAVAGETEAFEDTEHLP
ncbi:MULTISPECIES: tRNA pseudouridine(54/55) synthase Pus10 [Halobacterium]|uniref:tRNA pseudouridine(54/55) synthase Pus10 n=1 Tax=Halobacterium TaxID=2239 RepID=UPI0019660052|nr:MULTISPECIES: tRNA pseudouridine(54/55) synthase Pus10 [Halobacterium]MCF2206492.1 tRNA pseudouridine(54/55) synthase Pus10 [Halobacterium salinarum]MCF2239405.1 tRNA pseudouridine(54/55) synthase Pus10 [Halobacterium salinarum]MDL0122838.1 tRNA pseudouridine(54/55) synthase Pus10 [Halobacterium salinarum]MDL0128591.1 tRNA pseudouridine(54/55) synthase Pus10 [Halobacterium salinarum]MDL0132637.1 tRNA pseudouridine(54/55) synthase Pus10 [Halobacterium salinarum]